MQAHRRLTRQMRHHTSLRMSHLLLRHLAIVLQHEGTGFSIGPDNVADAF